MVISVFSKMRWVEIRWNRTSEALDARGGSSPRPHIIQDTAAQAPGFHHSFSQEPDRSTMVLRENSPVQKPHPIRHVRRSSFGKKINLAYAIGVCDCAILLPGLPTWTIVIVIPAKQQARRT